MPGTTATRPASVPSRWIALPVLIAASLVACASSPPSAPSGSATDGELNAMAIERTPSLPDNVATAILLGSALLEAGDLRGALEHYTFAHSAMPDDLEVGRRFVEVALRVGLGKEALTALDRMLVAHPGAIDLALQRLRVLTAMGEAELALRESAALLAAHPDQLEVLDLRSDLLMGQRDWPRALAVVDLMLEQRPEEPALWSRRAALLDAMEREDEAELAWRRTLELDPGDVHAVDRIAEILRDQARGDELITILEDLRSRTTVGPLVQARLADLYLTRGEFERTVELLEPLADQGVLEPHARLILADLLASLGRREEALELLEELVAGGVTGGPVLRMMGELQLDAGMLNEAESSLRAAIAADSSDVEAHVSLMIAIGQSEPALFRGEGDPGRRADFAAIIDRATELVTEGNLRQNYLLGAVLRRTGDLERAKPFLARAGELDPENRQVLYDLAVVQEGTKDYSAAAGTLEKLLAIDPDDPHLMNFYGYLLADQGWELQRAERLIRAAVDAEPDNGAYVDSLGWVLYRQGDLEGALEHLIRAANLVGDDPIVLEHLADCLRDLGQAEEALRTYRRALGAGGDRDRLEARIEAVQEDLRESP